MSWLLRNLYVCCMEFRKGVKGIDNARYILFVKAKCDLVMLPPTHYALELHTKRPNFQDMIWLQTDHAIINLENEQTPTIGWKDGTDNLEVV